MIDRIQVLWPRQKDLLKYISEGKKEKYIARLIFDFDAILR